jgi:hypothetical protein
MECAGLEAHEEAWKQSAACKILNDTTTGAMLEEVLAQSFEQILKKPPAPNPALATFGAAAMPTIPPGLQKATGAELVGIAKHMLNKGFVYAVCAPTEKTGACTILVIRGAAKKGVSGPFAKLLAGLTTGTPKLSIGNRASRRVILVNDPNAPKAKEWGWWGEKDKDLVVALDDIKTIDRIVGTLDGKEKNATAHPIVTELSAPAGAFQPIIRAFIDLRAVDKGAAKAGNPGAALMTQFANSSGVGRIDFRWGLDGSAVQSVFRVLAPSPRKPPLASLQPKTLDPAALPPIAKNAELVTATSISLTEVYDMVVAALQSSKPDSAAKFDEFVANLKKKTRLRLKEDVLGRIGPKMAFYTMPAPASGGLKIGFQVPKATVVADVADVVALGKALDELALFTNKELKAAFAEAAPPADSGERAGGGGGRNRPGGGGGGTSGSTSRRSAPAPEFRMSVGASKTYTLHLPPAWAALTNLQLTIALGKKHVVISTSSVAAKEALALESAKEGLWKPTAELSSSLQNLPKGLFAVVIKDPASSIPTALANLPADIEKSLNAQVTASAAVAANAPGQSGPQGGPPQQGGGRSMRPGMGGSSSGGSSPGGSNPGLIVSGPVGGGTGMAGQGNASIPGSGGAPGGNSPAGQSGTPDGAAGQTYTIKVDPGKIPSEDAIKGFLFPGFLAVTNSPEMITFTTRAAFPIMLSRLAGDSRLQTLQSVLTNGLSGLPKPGGANGAGSNGGANQQRGGSRPGGGNPGGGGGPGPTRPD